MGRAYSKRKKTKHFNILFCAVVLVFSILFMIALYIKAADLYEYKSQLAQAKKEQQQAVDKNLSLMYEITYQDTDAYIEKVARERLNLVKPNEIVYIDENK